MCFVFTCNKTNWFPKIEFICCAFQLSCYLCTCKRACDIILFFKNDSPSCPDYLIHLTTLEFSTSIGVLIVKYGYPLSASSSVSFSGLTMFSPSWSQFNSSHRHRMRYHAMRVQLTDVSYYCLCNTCMDYGIVIGMCLLLAGDVEENPGPEDNTTFKILLSLIHIWRCRR